MKIKTVFHSPPIPIIILFFQRTLFLALLVACILGIGFGDPTFDPIVQ